MGSIGRSSSRVPVVVAALVALAGCVGEPRPDDLETGPADAATDADVELDADADVEPDADGDGDGDGDLDGADAEDDRLCPANGDGVIQRAETPVSFELGLLYRVPPLGRQVSVDLAGALEDGVRTWHFEEPVSGERVVEERARTVEGTWFADEFPTATHAAPLSERYGYDGVYRLDDEALWLLGFVSRDNQGTRVTYDPPVPVLRYPASEGDTWTVRTTGSGWMSWVLFADTEEYTFTADATGDVIVPAGRFPVLRIRSELTQRVGVLVTRRVAYSFMAECWGRVAQVVSRDDERDLEFDVATDYRRLAFE